MTTIKLKNKTYTSKSAAIRSLANLGMKKSKIANILGIRPQMVCNVLKRNER